MKPLEIAVRIARSAEDFEIVAGFCRKLGEWDAVAAPSHGVSAKDVKAIFHPDRSGSELAAKFCPPDAMILLARVDEVPAGCLAFEPFKDAASELGKFFVDAPFRGKGIGRALMEAMMAEISKGRRRIVLIHTTFYMESAIALYTAFGFKPCSRFRDTPEQVRHTDVFMSHSLPPL
jgi:GNAT superfamily N-acetyltransferase